MEIYGKIGSIMVYEKSCVDFECLHCFDIRFFTRVLYEMMELKIFIDIL